MQTVLRDLYSNGLILDKAIMELVGLEENGVVQITVNNGSIIITPVCPRPVDMKRFEACLARLVKKRGGALRRLAK